MDQFQLTIAQIEAYDLIKLFDFASGGVGVVWGYLGSFGVKIQTFSNLDDLYIKMKPWVT